MIMIQFIITLVDQVFIPKQKEKKKKKKKLFILLQIP